MLLMSICGFFAFLIGIPVLFILGCVWHVAVHLDPIYNADYGG